MKHLAADKKTCVGCRDCEIACAAYHYNAFNSKRSRIRVPSSYPLPAAPKVCLQCKRPPCVVPCPNGSIFQDASGLVIIDQHHCNGCGDCIRACPFGAIFVDAATDLPVKCDLCSPAEPRCIGHCPTNALALRGA